jgi:hypothetical protein
MDWSRWPLRDIDRAIRRETRARDVFFHYRRGVKRYVPMALRPWVLDPAQRRYLRRVVTRLETSALRVIAAWFDREDLQALLPMTEGELRWLRNAYGGRFSRPETVFSRVDLSTQFERPDWKERARFLEVNLCGIGAAYYTWCAGQVAKEVFSPHLPFPTETEDDVLDMILERCFEHGSKVGRPRPTVALVENRRVQLGPYEYPHMAEVYRSRGYDVVVADPIELRVRGGEVYAADTRIDILYRDPTLAELVTMEADGGDLRAVKLALRRNQVVSSLAGEFDHKGVLELFSSPRWSWLVGRHRHVPWTRVLRPERVDGVDLPEHVRRRKDRLVLKPNRDYGGHGVAIGERTSAARWDEIIDDGLRHPGRWVAQERLPLHRGRFPQVMNGRRRTVERYVVAGVHATRRGVAVLARMSREPVVNITRGGAIVGVLVRGREQGSK